MSDWKSVPVEPTVDMLSAAARCDSGTFKEILTRQYKAMLAAAPTRKDAPLTREQIEIARDDLKTGYQASTWLVDHLCDMALQSLPVAQAPAQSEGEQLAERLCDMHRRWQKLVEEQEWGDQLNGDFDTLYQTIAALRAGRKA